ncbi:hypothetical protein [Bacillus sp. CECT 9360]|nr:hypothetical protein [Bacillus sp. CECT 9360]CAH0346670.1 hypothetical protein BCI9360_03015 [Bacillus sp. CECT 9360]
MEVLTNEKLMDEIIVLIDEILRVKYLYPAAEKSLALEGVTYI